MSRTPGVAAAPTELESQTTPPPVALAYVLPHAPASSSLMRELLALALPVWGEQALHMLVGLNDTYLANHLPKDAAAAGAAVGTITYFLWFIGLLVGSVGAGSTAIIARAKGARHRRLANSVTGQSVSAALLIGCGVGLLLFVGGVPIVRMTQLQPPADALALSYLRLLSVTLPFTMLMFIANACLRGGGDTITPAIVMIVVDIINMVCSFALCRGWWGLPVMGFNGIALGTIIAYVAGGVIQFIVLLRPGGAVRLYLHRMQPHWVTIKRLMRIGVPALVGDSLAWFANFGVIAVINRVDPTSAMSAAHMNTIRLESISFLSGIAFATAAATMVGMSLGMKDPKRAERSAYLAYLCGGGVMTLCGLLMITLGRFPARWLSPDDPHIIQMTTTCLFITGFIQSGFAASLIFGGALRGAGDTFVVMLLSLSTVIGVRFLGVIVVGLWLHRGLTAIWIVLAAELFTRGGLVYLRFVQGGWRKIEV
jgi:putative MATE family efflux protein